MTDSVQVIWEYLTVSPTSLYTLVGTRVWSPEAPVTWRNANAAIVYEMVDEERRGLPNNSLLVQFNCFGGKRTDGADYSHDDARDVYRALVDRLSTADGTATASGTILVCTLETSGQSYGQDETEWPMVECQYRFIIE